MASNALGSSSDGSWTQGCQGKTALTLPLAKSPSSAPAAVLTPVAQCSQNFSSIIAFFLFLTGQGRKGGASRGD